MQRCGWVGQDPLYVTYHDTEWGVPEHDDLRLFEKLLLDGAQAGLSWITILRKRDSYRAAFDGFDPEKMARYDDRKVAELLSNAGIVRNRQKVRAFIGNAQAFLALLERGERFDDFLWRFVGHRPRRNAWRSVSRIPPQTPESQAMSKALVREGFRFVGPTICYAFMQATGMVNDHVVSCFRYGEVS